MVPSVRTLHDGEVTRLLLPTWMRFAATYIEVDSPDFNPENPDDDIVGALRLILTRLHIAILERLLRDQDAVPTAIQVDTTLLLRRLLPPEILAHTGHLLQ
eukprot:3322354-Amphidinium_carterae.2